MEKEKTIVFVVSYSHLYVRAWVLEDWALVRE